MVVVNFNAGAAAQDAAANLSEGPTLTDNSVNYTFVADVTDPNVNVTKAVARRPTRRRSPIVFDVVFDETVVDFDQADVTLGGTAGRDDGRSWAAMRGLHGLRLGHDDVGHGDPLDRCRQGARRFRNGNTASTVATTSWTSSTTSRRPTSRSSRPRARSRPHLVVADHVHPCSSRSRSPAHRIRLRHHWVDRRRNAGCRTTWCRSTPTRTRSRSTGWNVAEHGDVALALAREPGAGCSECSATPHPRRERQRRGVGAAGGAAAVHLRPGGHHRRGRLG